MTPEIHCFSAAIENFNRLLSLVLGERKSPAQPSENLLPYQRSKALNRKLAALRQLVGDNCIQDMPQWVSFQNTYVCNLRCPHCETHGTVESREYNNDKKRNMSDEMLKRLMSETLPTADEYTLSLCGEPLATSNVDSILEQASNLYGAKLDLITNGTMLTKRRLAILIPRACRIQISIDGATKLTFEAIRLGAKFEHVMRSVRVLTRSSELLPEHLRPGVSFSYTIMGSNIRDLPLIVKLAHCLSVPIVNCHFITVLYDYVKNEAVDKHKALYNACHYEATKAARMLGIQFNLPPLLLEPMPAIKGNLEVTIWSSASFPIVTMKHCLHLHCLWKMTVSTRMQRKSLLLSLKALRLKERPKPKPKSKPSQSANY